MRKHTLIHFENEQGPKLFYADNTRVQIYEVIFDKEQFYSFMEMVEWDFRAAGVYIIVGSEQTDESDKRVVYIGETDSLRNRIINHMKDENKKWGERAFLISSKDKQNPFEKTEIHYFERELIKKFTASGYHVLNANDGQGSAPTAIERLILNEELSLIDTGLDSLGLQFDEEIVRQQRNILSMKNDEAFVEIYAYKPNSKDKIFGLFNNDRTITVLGEQFFDGKSKNSAENQRVVSRVISRDSNYKGLKISGDLSSYRVEYLENVTYTNPSAAGYLLAGGHNNGWITWRLKSNDKPIDTLRNKKEA